MRPIRLEDLNPRLQARIRKALSEKENPNHKATSYPSKRERCSGNAPVEAKKAEGHNRPAHFACPVRIQYSDHRKRLLDSDNGWTKYFTDSFVSAGILRDDTPSEIPERPSVRQQKSKDEHLIITITEI